MRASPVSGPKDSSKGKVPVALLLVGVLYVGIVLGMLFERKHASQEKQLCATQAPPPRLSVKVRFAAMNSHVPGDVLESLLANEKMVHDIFSTAAIELSFERVKPEGVLDYYETVTVSDVNRAFSSFPVVKIEPGIAVLVLSKMSEDQSLAGKMWNLATRNQIAIFAEADGSADHRAQIMLRSFIHELGHAFGLHHMDWGGRAYESQSTLEGYSDLASVQWCLKSGSAEYLANAPLPFVAPGERAAPFLIVSYKHFANFQPDPIEDVVPVPDTVDEALFEDIREGRLQQDVKQGRPDSDNSRRTDAPKMLEVSMIPSRLSFRVTDPIEFAIRIHNFGPDRLFIPEERVLQTPDSLLVGREVKSLRLYIGNVEGGKKTVLKTDDTLNLKVRVAVTLGFKAQNNTTGSSLTAGQYPVKMDIPLFNEKGLNTTVLHATSLLSLVTEDKSKGDSLKRKLEAEFGSRGVEMYSRFVSFMDGSEHDRVRKFLERLVSGSENFYQWPGVCQALLLDSAVPALTAKFSPAATADNSMILRYARCSVKEDDGGSSSAVFRGRILQLLRTGVIFLENSDSYPKWLEAVLRESIGQFKPGSSVVEDQSIGTVLGIANIVQGAGDVRVHLVGRADSNGNANGNCIRSEQRAEAVRSELIALGIRSDQIVLHSRGDLDEPKTDKANFLQQSRRVDAIFRVGDEDKTLNNRFQNCRDVLNIPAV